MKKAILYFVSIIIGVAIGVIIHCSFMVVEAKGCYMLPTIEPGQNVMISLLDRKINVGDVVAFEPPYYTLNGEGNILFRRVEQIRDGKVVLVCDASLAEEDRFVIGKDELLGKAILLEDK